MKNAVGREIPDYLLTEGREVYQGKNYMDGKYIQKASPRPRRASWWTVWRRPCASAAPGAA